MEETQRQNEQRDIVPHAATVEVVDAVPVSHANEESQQRISIGTLNIFREPLKRRYARYYHAEHPHRHWHILVDITLVTIIALLLGLTLYAFFFTGTRSNQRIALQATTEPTLVRSGDVTTFSVAYTNDNSFPLEAVTLTLNIPSDFTVQTATPTTYTEEQSTFLLGTLASGATGHVSLTGQFVADVGAIESIFASMSYDGTWGRKTTTATFPVRIAASVFGSTMTLPDTIVHDGVTPFSLTYINRGRATLTAATIEPFFGDDYTLVESSLPLVDGRFVIASLRPGEEGIVRGLVRIRGDGEAQKTIATRCYVETRQLCVRDASFTVRMVYPAVDVQTELDVPFVTPGRAQEVVVTFVNNEEETLVDLAIMLDATDDRFITQVTEATKETHADFAAVPAGESRVAIFPLTLREGLERRVLVETEEANPRVRIGASIRAHRSSDPRVVLTIDDVVIAPVSSDLGVEATARYFSREGDQLGRGPLPPVVGETTTYWAFVPLRNTYNDLENVVVTATVAPRVEWTGETSVTLGQPLRYDASSRTLTWNVGRVTRFTGGAYPDVGLAFGLALTPQVDDAEKRAPLLTDITVRARDSATDTEQVAHAPALTTELMHDTRAQGKGVIVR
jgi:hypothetical protein